METKVIKLEKPAEANIIIGQSHFIKTVEDIYEALINSVPGIKFGIGFCEASGQSLVRCEGTDEDLKKLAGKNALAIAAGHSFVIIVQNAYPINVLKAIKDVPEVCSIYCATANDVEVIITETSQGRGILSIIDGSKAKGIETENDAQKRKELLRKLRYKL
jgi:adenosine/AMP kinase